MCGRELIQQLYGREIIQQQQQFGREIIQQCDMAQFEAGDTILVSQPFSFVVLATHR